MDSGRNAAKASLVGETDCSSATAAASATCSCSSSSAPAASKPRWADVSDSESERAPPSDALSLPTGMRWADIPDSESDEAPPVVPKAPTVDSTDARRAHERLASRALPSQRDSSWTAPRSRAQHRSKPGAAVPAGTGQGQRRGQAKKYQCQFMVQIDEEPKFRVVGRLLGKAGANVKAIAAETDAKLRLRGRGSKFLEGPERRESGDPLMLCLSVSGRENYEAAKISVVRILERIYIDYDEFRMRHGESPVRLAVCAHEGAREGSR